MNEQSTPDSVWISREEYDRLRSAEARSLTQLYPTPHQTVASIEGEPATQTAAGATAPVAPAGEASNTGSGYILPIATVLCAIFAYVFPPLGLLFIILAIVTIVRSASKKTNTATKVASGVLVGVGFAILSPFLLIFGLIIMFQLNCAIDPSACRSA